jgi:hypothetical protein
MKQASISSTDQGGGKRRVMLPSCLTRDRLGEDAAGAEKEERAIRYK